MGFSKSRDHHRTGSAALDAWLLGNHCSTWSSDVFINRGMIIDA